MQQFDVDDELAALIERLAKPRPSENLSVNDALWRVMRPHVATGTTDESVNLLDKSMEGVRADMAKTARKAPTPSVTEWVVSVPELKNRKGLITWKAVCMLLKIDTAGNSARRKLKNWVKANRPDWPPVPDID
jgi:hypothetical protein